MGRAHIPRFRAHTPRKGGDTVKKQRSGFGIFAAAFFVSLSLLLLTMGTVMTATVRHEEEPPSSTDLSAGHYVPAEKDALRVLVITELEETGFSLLTLDPMAADIRLVTLPGELAADKGTLLSRWEYAGGGEAALALSSMDVQTDRWLHITSAGAGRIIDALGGMEWEFSEPFITDRLNIPVGRHLLDGETVLAIMAETDERLPETAELGASLIGQRLTEELLNNGDRFFQVLTANSDGNISQFDYQSRKKMLRWYLQSDRRTLTSHAVSGTETENGLLLTEEEKALLQ